MKKFYSMLIGIIATVLVLSTPVGAVISTDEDINSEIINTEILQAKPQETVCQYHISYINNETVMAYKSVKESFYEELGDYPALYNFNNKAYTGLSPDYAVINCETYYGIKAYLDSTGICHIGCYNNTDDDITINQTVLESLDITNGKKRKITNLGFEPSKLNYSDLEAGLYRITVDFSTEETQSLYFYIENRRLYFCSVMPLSTKPHAEIRRKALQKTLKEEHVTPKNSLSLNKVYYPYAAFSEDYRCDTQLWADLSKTLIEPSWSDERKVFVFCEWISENIAYDNYKVQCSSVSRAKRNLIFSGKYSVYNLKTGVCFDTAHILLIMCRANNIPAVTIGSVEQNHVWDAVYLNNRWYELDPTVMAIYCTNEEDTSIIDIMPGCDFTTMFTIFTQPGEIGLITPSDLKANAWFQKDTDIIY